MTNEWQPIETAPKGERKLVRVGKRDVEMHVAPRILTFTSAGDLTITYWIDQYSRWNMFTKNKPPTHWMPLPEPPR